MTWLLGLLRRRRARMVGGVIGVALAVALVGSLGAFFSASKARMTQQASRGVPVDWQVALSPNANVNQALSQIGKSAGVVSALPVAMGTTTHLRAVTGGSVQTTGPGKVIGLPPGYLTTFPREVRPLVGRTRGVMLAQQAAANLQVGVGSTVTIERPGLPGVKVVVDGVIDLPAADSLFQKVGAAPGTGPSAPPDNVVLLPLSMWHRFYDPVAHVRPSATQNQVHVDLSSALPADPGAAFASVIGRANNLNAHLAGKGIVGDNLAAQLDSTRGDAIYAQLLFLFLGTPGVVLALLLTITVTGAGGDRRRREQGLMRLRGATPRQILRLAMAEAFFIAIVGCLLGLAGATLAGRVVFGTTGFGATNLQSIAWGVIAVAVGAGIAFATILLPARSDARSLSVRSSQATTEPPKAPLWSRFYLDFALLLAGGLVFWQSVKSGYQVVLAPEGIPSISVNYFTLAAPLLLWLGASLVSWRAASAVLTRGRRALRFAVRPLAGSMAFLVGASMSRQRRLLARGLVIIGLAASFAVSTAVFDATYGAQSIVDAQLTNGADVSVTTSASSGLSPQQVTAVSKVAGVSRVEPMQHRFAYVGPDLQDLFGINPKTISAATPMSNAFFSNGNSTQTLNTLAGTTNGALFSEETVLDFQLHMGDTLRLRLQFAKDHKYHVVPFKYVGVVREFPTAPRDSFILANASYVARMTGSSQPQTLLIKTNSSPPAVASRVRNVLGPTSGATVQDIVHQLNMTLSGLTSLDLSGLIRLELGFAALFAAAASGLVLALGFAERRRTFAITTALGASTRQLASFVWSEALFVSLGGIFLGALIGWGVSFILVRVLTGVFDPPPAHLFVPWLYLGAVVITAGIAVLVAGTRALHLDRRSSLTILRDL
ncbi:MAG: putative transport system permease protein [Actinomycetota bacterium]|nr:putative transport system permease protein [Actinomycetota bacterium]